jgi:hypothetical protein
MTKIKNNNFNNLIGFILILLSFSAFSQHRLAFSDLSHSNDLYLGYVYQQPHFMQTDPVGDLLLLETMKHLPKSIWGKITNNLEVKYKIHQTILPELKSKFPDFTQDLHLEVEYDWVNLKDENETFKVPLEGRKKPFKLKQTKKMFLQIIAEEYYNNGIMPSPGKPHQWSQEFKQAYKAKYIIYKQFSKVFLCLVRGVCSRFLVTGQENALTDYILAQDYQSITIDQMFRASYRLHHGDLYLTLLTIENVLSRYWTINNRQHLAITKRLKPFTNFHYDTDIFGQWYHLFGIMLYGHTKGSLRAVFVGATESIGSQILSGFESERQENAINIQGGKIGAYLKKIVRKKLYQTVELDARLLDEESYLSQEDMSKRIERHKRRHQKQQSRQKKREEKSNE